ncbi:hypothetical protein [Paraburkholderia sp. BR14320]|uniref:hypothetical protein n=1 Tax=unclassified Paraburkholderia TaxID=2615204 RepID=UPI0034CF5020
MKLHNAKDLATVGAQIVEGRFRAGVFPHPAKAAIDNTLNIILIAISRETPGMTYQREWHAGNGVASFHLAVAHVIHRQCLTASRM